MYSEILESIGFPKNEAKIYEALLKIAPAGISAIASTAKVNRRNVYDTIKNLANKNLVTWTLTSEGKMYEAMEPKELLAILTNERNKAESIQKEIMSVYEKTKLTEEASIARGGEAIKNFWRFVLSQKEPVYYIGGKGAWHDKNIDEFRHEFFKECKEKGIQFYGIFDYEVATSSWGEEVYKEYDPKITRFLPKGYSTSSTRDICNNRVMVFTLPKERSVENSTVITLVSKPLAESHIKWFHLMWSKCKTLDEIKGLKTRSQKK